MIMSFSSTLVTGSGGAGGMGWIGSFLHEITSKVKATTRSASLYRILTFASKAKQPPGQILGEKMKGETGFPNGAIFFSNGIPSENTPDIAGITLIRTIGQCPNMSESELN
jgi:hypothetical protein